MKRPILWILVAIALLLLAGYAAGSWYFSTIALARPTQTLEEGRARSESFAELGLPQPEEVTIDTGDVTLSGFYFENDLAGDCGVVLLHGYTGTRYGALQYAPLFWERGCDLLAYDHRGHGASTPTLHTFGYYEKEDLAAAVDWFTARAGLEPADVGIVGVSYGASTALQAAPLLPDAAFILADSAYQDLESILRYQGYEQFGNVAMFFLPGALIAAELRTGGDVQAISAQDAIAKAEMPILLVHSQQDEYTPPSHAETIYARSDKGRTVLHLYDWGSPHAQDIITNFDAYKADVDQFLASYAPDFGLAQQ